MGLVGTCRLSHPMLRENLPASSAHIRPVHIGEMLGTTGTYQFDSTYWVF
jgi:hypothetical protein